MASHTSKYGRNKKRYAKRSGAGLRKRHGDRTGHNGTQSPLTIGVVRDRVCNCRTYVRAEFDADGNKIGTEGFKSDHHVGSTRLGRPLVYTNNRGEFVAAYSVFSRMKFEAVCEQLGLPTITKRQARVAV